MAAKARQRRRWPWRRGSYQDQEQEIIELAAKQEAHSLLKAALAAGELGEAEYERRRIRVYQAVTARDLWRASGGRAGSKRRADWRFIRKAVILQVAILIFSILAMFVILYGTILFYKLPE